MYRSEAGNTVKKVEREVETQLEKKKTTVNDKQWWFINGWEAERRVAQCIRAGPPTAARYHFTWDVLLAVTCCMSFPMTTAASMGTFSVVML